jgi:hypothetical protein
MKADLFIADRFGGIRIIESPMCVKRWQFRFPRTKKKRTRAKWAKREENYKTEPAAMIMGLNQIVAHPALVAKFRAEIGSLTP